jgi:hypothetical protein
MFSQKSLQYFSPGRAGQWQPGWAHLGRVSLWDWVFLVVGMPFS